MRIINCGNFQTTFGAGVILRGNHVHKMLGPGIHIENTSASALNEVLIERNNIHNQIVGSASGGGSTHGSGIAIWGQPSGNSGKVTMKKNIVWDCGNTALIRTYPDGASAPEYDDITIENNLLYNSLSELGIEFTGIKTGILVRNNTLIGRYKSSPGGEVDK
jgi:hypothetical protein